MYRLTLEIPGLPELNPSARLNRWLILQRNRQWTTSVWAAFLEAGRPKPERPLEKAHIKMTRMSSVVPDHDNLVTSFKYILDLLQPNDPNGKRAGLLGVIRDDSPSTITTEYVHEKSLRGKGGIRIEVTEMEP